MLLRGLIRFYWLVWPAAYRRRCLFRLSCSRHVYLVTRRQGLLAGLRALRQRTQQCRPGAYAFVHPLTGAWCLQLPDGSQLSASQASPHVRRPT